MALNKAAKHVIKCLEDNGYTLERVNSKGFQIYVAGGRRPIGVNPRIGDRDAKVLVRNLERDCGGVSDSRQSKRKPDRIKARQAIERDRAAEEVERRKAEVEALLAERDARMGRAGFSGSDADFKEFLIRLEREERELAYWQKLMTEIPHNENRVRHRA